MPYLAMTAAEMQNCSAFPEKIAWMACHFSPSNAGLDNLPKALPAGALIILDDSTPVAEHDARTVARQLYEAVQTHNAAGILLDLQRPDVERTRVIAREIAKLPCPVAATPAYASDLIRAVFLPPVPPNVLLEQHLRSARGKEIWLEIAPNANRLTLTEQGCRIFDTTVPSQEGFYCSELFCHYHAQVHDNAVHFNLWRTKEDVAALLRKARSLGVQRAIGLWQELK